MKYLTLLILPLSLLATEPLHSHLKKQVDTVEHARAQSLKTIGHYLETVEKNPHTLPVSDAARIIEADAIATIARETANVEIVKTQAMAEIAKALDALESADPKRAKEMENDVLKRIADAITSVELSKAAATQKIVKSAHTVALGKRSALKPLAYPKEALVIAKNASAVQIAQSVANAEVAKAVAAIEIAHSSMRLTKVKPDPEALKALENIKAEATANISSYLAHIEVVKANMLAKIAREVAKVEVAKAAAGVTDDTAVNTYPKKLIRAN
jgi:hypothetical protein